MELFKVCALGMLALAITSVIKQWKADWLPLVRVALVAVLGTLLLTAASPILDFLREVGTLGGISEEVTLLLRACGIALLAQVAAVICRECGEGGIADAVELAGKIELLLLCIPLINELLSLAREMLASGGQ